MTARVREQQLSWFQLRVFAGVAVGDVRCNPNGVDGSSWWADVGRRVDSRTLAALVRRALIRRPKAKGTETEAAWQLTPAGHALAAELRLLPKAGGGQR